MPHVCLFMRRLAFVITSRRLPCTQPQPSCIVAHTALLRCNIPCNARQELVHLRCLARLDPAQCCMHRYSRDGRRLDAARLAITHALLQKGTSFFQKILGFAYFCSLLRPLLRRRHGLRFCILFEPFQIRLYYRLLPHKCCLMCRLNSVKSSQRRSCSIWYPASKLLTLGSYFGSYFGSGFGSSCRLHRFFDALLLARRGSWCLTRSLIFRNIHRSLLLRPRHRHHSCPLLLLLARLGMHNRDRRRLSRNSFCLGFGEIWVVKWVRSVDRRRCCSCCWRCCRRCRSDLRRCCRTRLLRIRGRLLHKRRGLSRGSSC